MQIRIHLKISIRLLTDGLGGLLHWLAQKSGLLVFQAAVDVVDCWPGFALHIGGEFATLQIVKLLQDHPRDEQSGEPKRWEWVSKYFFEIKQKKKRLHCSRASPLTLKACTLNFYFENKTEKELQSHFSYLTSKAMCPDLLHKLQMAEQHICIKDDKEALLMLLFICDKLETLFTKSHFLPRCKTAQLFIKMPLQERNNFMYILQEYVKSVHVTLLKGTLDPSSGGSMSMQVSSPQFSTKFRSSRLSERAKCNSSTSCI